MTGTLPRILLAEDNDNDLELTVAALRSHRIANEVDVVHDGAEALDYLYSRGRFTERPDGPLALILLDLKMPKVDGLEVLRQIKADPDLRLTPVVMLTSSREEVDLLQCRHDRWWLIQLGAFWAVLNEPPPIVSTSSTPVDHA